MATFLDVGLLEKFGFIFPFLLVLIVVWGGLSYSKFLGDNKFVHSIIALVLAILALFSDSIRQIINAMSPWFVLLFVFILFALMAVKIFGFSDEEVMSTIKGEYSWIIWTVVGIAIFITIFSIIDTKVWNEDTQNSEDKVASSDVGGGDKESFFAVLRHPLVLGMALILLIGVYTIQKLSS